MIYLINEEMLDYDEEFGYEIWTVVRTVGYATTLEEAQAWINAHINTLDCDNRYQIEQVNKL